MKKEALIKEPLSSDIFERYYRLIENIRLKIWETPSQHGPGASKDLLLLETIVHSLDRVTQDIETNSENETNSSHLIVSATISMLKSTILVLASWEIDDKIIPSLVLNFFVALSSLIRSNEFSYEDYIRHINKLSIRIIRVDSRQSGLDAITSVRHLLMADVSDNEKFYAIRELIYSYNKNKESTEIEQAFSSEGYNDTDLPHALLWAYAQKAEEMINRLQDDYFKVSSILFNCGVDDPSDMIELAKEQDFFALLEALYDFDEEQETAIWEMDIKISNEQDVYDAAEVSYLIWTIAKALSTIEGIDVELTSWGDGSKWAKLKIRIRQLASKVDLLQILKKVGQITEAAYLKKPVEDLQNTEASTRKIDQESKKIERETRRLERETENMMDSDKASFMHDLEIHQKVLDLRDRELNLEEKALGIEEKALDLEEKALNVKMKQLDYIMKVSELFKSGLQNDSDIQIKINEQLFLKRENGKLSIGNTALLDINQQIEPKVD
ncbi:MAG: hypothetical protein J7623_11470 [Chitinophaga sp.]|uniref:hypothetical protein n=1 Tax=Chitinophaga sp. TaxID=1869181 RepID=UPI001B2D2788|nr:hypothetical protein [Chitinophaga sp.]MBO9729246.1 hypothetical protein [Chitinophaga sp.]